MRLFIGKQRNLLLYLLKASFFIAILLLLYTLVFLSIYPTSYQLESRNKPIGTYFDNQTIDYPIKEETICSNSGPDILIGVHSSPNNSRKRNAIRSSYGSFKRIRDHTIQVIFIVGMTRNEIVNRQLHQESDYYRDIVQSNFIDSYHNLTLKHVALLNWVDIYCGNVSYFVKADDDTLIDVFHLEYFLRTYDLKSDFYCKAIHARVLRNGKWKVSREEYPDNFYPPYCEGFAYILTNVKKLSQLVYYALNEKYFWIDDVFLLGTIRLQLHMTLKHFPENFGHSDIMESSKLNSMNFIFFRDENNKNNEILWNNVWNSILLNSIDLYS